MKENQGRRREHNNMNNHHHNNNNDIWLHWSWLLCCTTSQHTVQTTCNNNRRRIDRTMIGNPTNFQHTGHIGSNDVGMPSSLLNRVQNQMQSKGGYEMAYPIKAY